MRNRRVATFVALALSLLTASGACSRLDSVSPSPPASDGPPEQRSTPPPLPPATPPEAGDAPTLWYEAVTASESLLLAVPIDGSAPPALRASRPAGPQELGRRWEVGPAGDRALWVHPTGDAGRAAVEGVDLSTGGSAWRLEVDGFIGTGMGIWSADGLQWATATQDPEGDAHGSVVIDIASGTGRSVPAMAGAWPIGFTARGDLVLGERLVDDLGWTSGWRFHRSPRPAGATEPLPLEDLRDATLSGEALEIAASQLTGVRRALLPEGQPDRAVKVELIDLVTDERRIVGPEQADRVSTLAFTPDGRRLIVTEWLDGDPDMPEMAIVALDLDGAGAEIWRGPNASQLVFSFDGRYLATSSWAGRSTISVVNLETGSAADVPLPERLVQAAPRAIRSDRDVPVLAIAVPTPTPPPPPTPVPSPIPEAPLFAVAWVEETRDGNRLGRVDLHTPAEGGGSVVTASMEPLELGADENVHAVPVEGGEDWVIIASAQPGIRLWRWTPGARPAATELPAKLAALASFGLLHPDGRRMVIAHADETGQHSQVSVVDLRPATFTTFTLASPYTELAGWAGDGGRLVLGHHICTEGCEGRHAYLAWLDPTSGRVSPFGATDRDSRVPAWFVVPYPDRGEVLLTSIHEEEADDIVLRWPAGEPMPDIRYHDWTASPTDLYLELVEADVATLAVVRDAASLGPGRHQTSPERLGALPAGLRITSLGPLEGWVMAADRADELYLIDLQRGTAGPISRSEPGSVQWDDGR